MAVNLRIRQRREPQNTRGVATFFIGFSIKTRRRSENPYITKYDKLLYMSNKKTLNLK